jgi:hypothetical protein
VIKIAIKRAWNRVEERETGYLTILLLAILFVSLALLPSAGYCLLVPRGFVITHNEAPQSVDSSGRVISWSQTT